MRIGITCYPSLGGSGALATELGKKLAKKGHKIHFISSEVPFRLIGPWQKNVTFHQVDVLEYPLFQTPPYILALANKIAEVARQNKLEILHAHYAVPHSVAIYLAKQILLRNGGEAPKTVTTLHGTDVSVVGDDLTMKDITGFAINSSDGVTAPSRYLAEEATKIYGTNPVEIIYNFVDLKPYKETSKIELKSIFAKENEKVIIHVSNFREVKRIQDVVNVFHIINKKVPSKLLLVGDGPDQKVAYRLAGKYNLINKVHFMGIQTNVEKILSISDLFLLPSEKENFSLSALEAMACGVPVIASNVGGMPEMIVDGESGFLCEIGDVEVMAKKGIEILKDEVTAKKIAMAAQSKIKESFSPEIIVPQYEAYYEKILAKK